MNNKRMNVFKGIVIALISSLLAGIIFAYVFRIPIPLGGYIGPFGEFGTHDRDIFEVTKLVFSAWLFYGIFGGFVILAVLGAAAGVYAGRKSISSSDKNKKIFFWASCAALVPVLLISVLDYLIGPW